MTIVYGVHVVRAHELEPTQVVFNRLAAAEEHAKAVSGDTGVLAGAVTRYVVDGLGQRTPVALFVAKKRQTYPHISDDRLIYASAVRKTIKP